MLYDMMTLKEYYKEYSNINQKICNELKNNKLVRIKKGLFSDNINKDFLIGSNCCYGPSYISFEYALAYYGLIPEFVSIITCAVFNKNKNKTYKMANNRYVFEYKHVPNEAFPYGIVFLKDENGFYYKIASKEKALCDLLYVKYPVRSLKDINNMLFDDLRIDYEQFKKLDKNKLIELCPLYHSNTLNTFKKYILEVL